MALLRRTARGLVILVALSCLAAGGLALASAYRPQDPLVARGRDALLRAAEVLEREPMLAERVALPPDLAARVESALDSPVARFALAPLGLVLLVGTLLPGRAPAPVDPRPGPAAPDRRDRRRLARSAAALARRGSPLEAAELAHENGLLEEAARYFIQAEHFERAAECRHDQNRFVEAAELHLRAGRPDTAGSIFAQQGEFARAAEAYMDAGNHSLAGEMFTKLGDPARAGRCFADAGFHRHAAQAFVQAEAWTAAAECLEQVLREEASGGLAEDRSGELHKLHKMAGNLFARGGQDERALQVLERGRCHAEAAVVALRLGEEARAAELYLDARDPQRAAEILRRSGDATAAARVLGEYHRDRGENEQAARCFEEAGEDLAAGDLYRLLERYDRAAECFERQDDHAQAGDLFRAAGERQRAARAYERAERFAEAAECHALAGDTKREAELLEQAGSFLRAGEIHQREGRVDEAIKVLQRVASDGPDAPPAAALLGRIFHERGMFSLAVKKLRQALDGQTLETGNVPAFYQLAQVLEASEDLAEARDLYEKILAFDYHYADAGERLEHVRGEIESRAAANAVSADAEAPFANSRQVGRYQVVGKLGRGGMGIVYKARDTVLDRVVALKVLPEQLKENPQALKNFLREAQAAAQLNHPGIVTIYDAGEQDGVYYIAMEYVDGSTLKEIVKHRGGIPVQGLVRVLAQMCEALAYAHEKKIVHRDIKTANTMWTRDRKAKIMDFGLARLVEEVRNHTTVVSGTPYYMSPEQTLGRNIDHRTDIYSLGVTIFELATGTLPFRDGNLPYHHVHTAPPDPRGLNPDLPAPLARVIGKCLQKDPAHRYQSAREILTELKNPA